MNYDVVMDNGYAWRIGNQRPRVWRFMLGIGLSATTLASELARGLRTKSAAKCNVSPNVRTGDVLHDPAGQTIVARITRPSGT